MMQPSHGVHDDASRGYDAVLYLSFGGPEGPDDVMPFLENVTRGRGVPRQRLEEVARHYYRFGGVSPINTQNRAVIAALRRELARNGPDLPIYWGNRNWKPYLADTLRQMRDDRVRRAICFVTSAYSSYSGCRQYREDIAAVQASIGRDAPVIDKLRAFYNHPGFVAPMIENLRTALQAVPEPGRAGLHLAFSAHSIPTAMAEMSSYVQQLGETARLVAAGLEDEHDWELVFQSRSGPPHEPWLEPNVSEHFEKLQAQGVRDVVVVPVGFVSDHLEVRFDLDVEAADTARRLGMNMVRAESVGAHPAYVRMIRDLIFERTSDNPERPSLGRCPAGHDICAADCCPARPGAESRPAAAQLPG